MIEQIKQQLEDNLPKEVFTIVEPYSNIGIKIGIYLSDRMINGVRGQYPQLVSLFLDLDTMELQTQVFGGNGGGRIYRQPNMEDKREKLYVMIGEKVPFRKPKSEEKFVLEAIGRFARNYIETLKKHKDTLRYKNMVDYSFLD